MAKEDTKGAFAVVEGRRLSLDTVHSMSEWTRLLYSGQLNDEQMLELFFHLTEMPGGEIMLDPRSIFKVNGVPIDMPGMLKVYEAIVRHRAGNQAQGDSALLAKFIQLIRDVIKNKHNLLINPA